MQILFFSSRRRHTRYIGDLSSDVCSSDLYVDSTFYTGTGIARLIYPQDKATAVDPNLTLSWSTVPDAITYYRSEERRVGKEGKAAAEPNGEKLQEMRTTVRPLRYK